MGRFKPGVKERGSYWWAEWWIRRGRSNGWCTHSGPIDLERPWRSLATNCQLRVKYKRVVDSHYNADTVDLRETILKTTGYEMTHTGGMGAWSWLHRPFCERDVMFCACFFFFTRKLTFSDARKRQPTFSKLFHMTWLQPQKKALLCRFHKSAPIMRGDNHQISPNFSSNRDIVSTITCDVEGKWKIKKQ